MSETINTPTTTPVETREETPTPTPTPTENNAYMGNVDTLFTKPPVMQQYVNEFYAYMYVEFAKYVEMVKTNDESLSKFKSFIDYWCYRLYGDYGVKRKLYRYGSTFETEDEQNALTEEQRRWYTMMYGPKMNSKLLLQFFYDKSIPSYNKSKSITRLCRHMLFDVDSLSIVSLGVLKSLDETDFYKKLDVMNNVNDVDTHEDMKYNVVVEEFLEGTMIIYNHAMTKYNYNKVSKANVEETDNTHLVDTNTVTASATASATDSATTSATDSATTTATDSATETANKDKPTKDEQTKKSSKKPNFMVATRRKIGTSFFNKPGKTFYEMFEDNNKREGIDLSLVEDDDINSICLVFNVEHEDNRIITPNPSNRNTLVSAYIIKPSQYNKDIIMSNIMPYFKCSDNGVYECTDMQSVQRWFYEIALLMVTEVSPQYVQQQFISKYNINFHVPSVVKNLQDTRENITNDLMAELAKLNEYSPGYMIRDVNSSMRYKVRKDTYKELLELKGHYPISINEKNKENVFKCYWKLRQSGQPAINKFLKLFDNKEKEYRALFEEFKKEIHGLTHTLYLQYMSVFVDKEKHAREIPYLFAPLIGDLHTEYKKTKKPTTKQRVVEYINALPVYKVYWRIFNPELADNFKSSKSSDVKTD
jgi:hypothetical protein